jgi:hypothetical protein
MWGMWDKYSQRITLTSTGAGAENKRMFIYTQPVYLHVPVHRVDLTTEKGVTDNCFIIVTMG